jgi:DNA polymerase I-like protein with 3'-5' exonuclease and polymerase domains
MPLFDISETSSKAKDVELLKKSKTRAKAITTTKSSSGNLVNKIKSIVAMVETHLGKYRDETLLIQDEETLHSYIDKCIENGIYAIDTETTGLDPLLDMLVGVGIYTPGEKTTYIPINHLSYITGQKVKNQLPAEIVGKELARLDGIDSDMFNATFDIRVLKHGTGTRLKCTWDSYLASRCLNENEPNKGLKKLHLKYVLRGEEDAFKFDELFKGINFAYIPINTAALYAAHDPKITYEYADYQREVFRTRENLKDVYWVFKNIEMPCVDAVVDLEDTGVAFDIEYNEELKRKYHAILDEKEANFHKLCEMYKDEIDNYSGTVKLDTPINIQSVPQLQALLYDIAKIEPVIDKKTKKPTRSTSEETLQKLKNPLADAILEYRSFSTLVSTFIDKLPECINPNDGRIHCKFNQYGADTGRFSSQDPNLQNIPSHNKDIRKMFKATDGYIMMSADYSQQEIKGMAQMCGDEGMIEAFRQGKDFYAEIASVAFGYPYEECREFRPDGTTNPDGKARRAQAKSILLGINYGRGAASIAEQIGCTKAEAEKIKDDVFTGFPAIAEFERQSIEMAETVGYVTTLWGRKRRLPSMMLPDYEFQWEESKLPFNDDPLDFDDEEEAPEIPDSVINKYLRKLSKCWGSQKRKVFEEARADGIMIIDHTKDKDYTKIVNARVQGTAADMSKLAMIALNKNERLKELGFRMLIPIHDEILAECPEENAAEVIPLFAKIMSEAPGERFVVPISCDVEVTHRWYGKKYHLVDGKLVEETE